MVIVEINSGNHGSVGNVMLGIAEMARKRGHSVYTFCPPGHMQKQNVVDNLFIGTVQERQLCNWINGITGLQGSLNYFGTWKLIQRIKKINPDVIHLHNLHSNYVNLQMLFHYLSTYNGKIFWTLHDCWPFTGNCPHFTMMKCEKWKLQCTKCSYRGYPKGNGFDCGDKLFLKKREMFTSIPNMTIVTPSYWLAELVSKSFLQKYPVKVIHNGINLNVFKPTPSDFRERYDIREKKCFY